MPKFKYRIMNAKVFLKGTSGTKVLIILQTFYLVLKKKKNCKHKGL